MPSQAVRIGVTIDQSVPVADQRPVSLAQPILRPVQVTTDQVKDATVLAKQLSSLQNAIAQTTQAARSNPMQAPIFFTNVTCPTAGGKIRLTHSLGRFAYWMVVGWRGDSISLSPRLISDQLDGNPETNESMLCLRSYVAGVADLAIF